MVKVNTNSNTIKVNAASAGRASNLSIGTPQSYYDGLAKEWAISDNLVQGIDYSSKYYANIAKSNADSSKANLDSVRDAAEEVIAAKDNALNDISDAKINTLESLIDEGNNQIELIKEQGSSYATKEDAKYTAGNGIDITDNIISNTQTSAEWGNITGNIENQEDLVNYVKKYSGGLEVCDIGMSLYIDETKGLRRWLNGQIVAINQNTQGFLTRLKKIVALYPSLLTTEENWQAAKTMSAFGQVGKFVFNYSGDDIVSVRIPAIVNVQGLFDLQNLGVTVAAGLPNITGTTNQTVSGNTDDFATEWIGAIKTSFIPGTGIGLTENKWTSRRLTSRISLDASHLNPTYGAADTVQEEAIQYPYFIQIATGQETEVNIRNEIELNNPFFFGMSQYFDVEPNNLSWLKSDGVYKPKSVYPDYYNWILENVNKGVEGFKGKAYAYSTSDKTLTYWITSPSPAVGQIVYGYTPMKVVGKIESLVTDGFVFTETILDSQLTLTRNSQYDTTIADNNWINDYDFVINTSDETFRLPIKAINSNYKYSHFPDFNNKTSLTTNFIAPNNGWFCLKAGTQGAVTSINGVIVQDSFPAGANYSDRNIFIRVKKGDTATAIGNGGYFVPEIVVKETDCNDLFLYYYVGETVQNANLIDAGRMQEQITNINAPSRGYLVQSYVNGTSGYRVYSDGWCEQWGKSNSTSGQETITLTKAYNSINFTVLATSYTNNFYGTAQIINNKTIWIESRGHDFTVQPCLVRWLTMGYIS